MRTRGAKSDWGTLDIAPEREDSVDMPVRRQWFGDRRFGDRRVLKRIVLAVLVFLILPYALIFFYLLPFIHPVSTLMLRDLLLLRGYDLSLIHI